MESFDLRLWKNFCKAGGDPSTVSIVDQITIDSRRIDSPNSLFVALRGKVHDGHQFVPQAVKAGVKYALVHPDWIPPSDLGNVILLRYANPLTALQEIAASYRSQQKALVIGITGSYGKTLLKDLLQAILRLSKQTIASPESFNSQIGVALSLLMMKKSDEVAIIEAGISHPGEMDTLAEMIAPDISILTNIDNAHASTLKTLSTTAEEKAKLLKSTHKNYWSLVSSNDYLQPHLCSLKQKVHFWDNASDNLPHAEYISNERSAKMSYRVTFPDKTVYEGVLTSGFHYFLDLINIAAKAAWLLGISSHTISVGLKNYTPEQMRTEIWKSPNGVTFINNTYCSDPQSVDLALKYFDQAPLHSRKVFVFGGMRADHEHIPIDYRRIGQAITKSKVNLLVLYDNHNYSSLIQEVAEHSPSTEITTCKDYSEVVNQLQHRIKYDDLVLIKGSKKESIDHLIQTFNDSISNNQCIINLSAVQANIEALRNHVPPKTRFMAIIKALAYGTDDVRMSKFLASCGIDILGVSYVDEAVALKRSGVKQDVFVLNVAPYEAAKAVKWDLEVGVSDSVLIEALAREATQQGKVIKVHLHIDTGMSRFGCRPEEALALAKMIKGFTSLKLEGLMTHFASADNDEDDAFTHSQVKKFDEVIGQLNEHHIDPPWKHACNSSGSVRFKFDQYNMVRIGLALYGLYPSETVKKALELRLALSLTSRIVGINICKEGESISYGRSYVVKKGVQRIAVLPIGYFDGLHRNYSGKSHVIIRGCKAPMVGKICMDYMMVDVTEIPNVAVGDNVLIFGVDEHGQYLSPEDLASKGNSIAHELVTCLGPRIQRVFINEF